jgi:hypothetical protein
LTPFQDDIQLVQKGYLFWMAIQAIYLLNLMIFAKGMQLSVSVCLRIHLIFSNP